MTTDTPRTDAAWKVTTFSSALLEHDGEVCNEIHCASPDEAECLVELLNEMTAAHQKLEAEVESFWSRFDRQMKAEAEVERLRANLRRAIEIAEDSNDSLMDWDENSRCEVQKKNRAELDQLEATLNQDNK